MGAAPLLLQQPRVGDRGGKGQPGPLGATHRGRWAWQDGEVLQANFVLQKPLQALSLPRVKSTFWGWLDYFLIKFYKPDFAHQKGAIQRMFFISSL